MASAFQRARMGIFTTAAVAVLLAAGCDEGGGSPEVGSYCVIQFRRDFLGASADMPVTATQSIVGEAEVGVGGTLRKMTAEWIVIESQGRDLWIPRASILYMDVTKKQGQ